MALLWRTAGLSSVFCGTRPHCFRRGRPGSHPRVRPLSSPAFSVTSQPFRNPRRPPAPAVFPPLPHVRPTPAGAERVARGRGRVPLPEDTLRCRPRLRLSRKPQRRGVRLSKLRAGWLRSNQMWFWYRSREPRQKN